MTSNHSLTVAEVSAIITDEKVKERLDFTKSFVENFYGPCATGITAHANNGRMTKYWWELPQCMPKPNATDASAGAASCLTGGTQMYEVDGDNKNALTCTPQTKITSPKKTSVSSYTIDQFVDRFCMPEIDTSI